jgi:hypothetical protein
MTRNSNSTLTFKQIGKGRSLKDAFVVAFLAIVLGAFVAQISTSHKADSPSQPYATAASATASQG